MLAPTARFVSWRKRIGGSLVRQKVATTLTLLCLVCMPALAQDFRATISGHVFDSSGGSVPNVKIQVTNADTNEVTTATSDNAGAYSIPLLRPGDYKLSASSPGFKQFIRDGITCCT